MDRGFIKLYRAIWDNPHWEEKPFEPSRAWIDMLLLANYKDSQFRKRGNIVVVRRGQIGISIKGLGDRWGWSPGKVDRFLQELSVGDEPQIEYQKSNITTLITILNYDKYQSNGEQNGYQTDTKRIPNGAQTETSKEVKELKKKEKKEYILPLLGEHLNVKVTEKEMASLKEYVGGESAALDLIERLSIYLKSTGKRYPNHYATMQGWHRREGVVVNGYNPDNWKDR